jgi:hypothetical protein
MLILPLEWDNNSSNFRSAKIQIMPRERGAQWKKTNEEKKESKKEPRAQAEAFLTLFKTG